MKTYDAQSYSICWCPAVDGTLESENPVLPPISVVPPSRDARDCHCCRRHQQRSVNTELSDNSPLPSSATNGGSTPPQKPPCRDPHRRLPSRHSQPHQILHRDWPVPVRV